MPHFKTVTLLEYQLGLSSKSSSKELHSSKSSSKELQFIRFDLQTSSATNTRIGPFLSNLTFISKLDQKWYTYLRNSKQDLPLRLSSKYDLKY
jgi:hypothetical protein